MRSLCQSTIQVYQKLDECIKYVFIYSGWVSVVHSVCYQFSCPSIFCALLKILKVIFFYFSMFKLKSVFSGTIILELFSTSLHRVSNNE